ncbi:MAG: porin family protein [Devosia sp.]|uniref:outer membrane protein n=1 Tax=Devosia sp. TaxID=1871048 RepID=UPI002623DC00|nr:outer membrane protein [Devosia sp.]MDB5530367.1 porin family protein [Devosia sp.]
MNKFLISTVALTLLTGSASAADFGVITQDAPAGYIAPTSDWTGFYAGVFGGVGGGSPDLTMTIPGGGPVLEFFGNSSGGLAGVQVGADYQIGDFVLGAVTDIAVSNIEARGGAAVPIVFGYESPLNYLGTVRGRIGFLPTDNLLAYVHGGLAYGQTSPDVTVPPPAGADLDPVNRVGYTIGAGFEYKLTDNISVQTEYAYTNLGNASVSYTPFGGFPAGVDIKESYDFHTVKAGVNFRF